MYIFRNMRKCSEYGSDIHVRSERRPFQYCKTVEVDEKKGNKGVHVLCITVQRHLDGQCSHFSLQKLI